MGLGRVDGGGPCRSGENHAQPKREEPHHQGGCDRSQNSRTDVEASECRHVLLVPYLVIGGRCWVTTIEVVPRSPFDGVVSAPSGQKGSRFTPNKGNGFALDSNT